LSNKPRANTPEEKRKEAEKLAILFLGDPDNGIEPKRPTEIQRILGFKSDKTYKDRKKLAIDLGLLKKDNFGRVVKPDLTPLDKFKTFKDQDVLKKNPLIEKWWKKKSKKNNNKGTKQQFTMLRNLIAFFNTVKITPEMLVAQKNSDYVVEMRDLFMEHYFNKTDWRLTKTKHGDFESKKYNLNQALNSFCNMNGIVWERGTEEMSRKVVGHGKYKKVRFTKEDFKRAEEWLIKFFGIDSDEYRWFWIGVETCSRAGALMVMKLDYEEVLNKDGSTKSLHLETFESKLEHTKAGGEVEKFVRRKNTIISVKALRKRGAHLIYENKKGLSRLQLMKYFTETMKSLYTFLGKDEKDFFFIRPNHTLRHLGAQYWLLKSDFRDFNIVAKIGDWGTVKEMVDSYGDTPPEVFQRTLDGYEYDD